MSETSDKINLRDISMKKVVNNSTTMIITREDMSKLMRMDRLLKRALSLDSKGILSKYKSKEVDLESIREEQYTLESIQENIREKQIDCLHYCYMRIAKLYYKYREIDADMLSESSKYYLLDLELLPKYKDFIIDKHKEYLKEYGSNLDEDFLYSGIIEGIKNGSTYGAEDTFKRLIIIYEKQGLHDNALGICDKAIEFGENNIYYDKKKKSIEKKLK
jgi:hypothetical protein